MERTYIKDTIKKIGETVLLKGWVAVRRDHGKLIFLDLRDMTGLIQLVVNPKVSAEAHTAASEIRNEFVIEVEGLVKARDEKLINPNLETGKVEVEVTKLNILSRAKALPFEVNEDTKKINEEARMKYRYLDLRSDRMAKNMRLRHKAATLVREYLNKQGFVEIETPMLTKSSPEGARDFLVPSRLQPGKFYALPQAPQQYKQLLMIAGIEKYYQMARAMRDEDLRGDRQLEHTQIDLEMSFVKERDVLDLVEGLMINVAEACGKKIWKKPFPVFTHEEAIKQFGADKFDLRGEKKDPDVMAFAWVVDFPLLEFDEDEKRYTFAHNPFSAPKAEHVEKLMKSEDLGNLRAQQYDLVCNGLELASGGVRISDPAVQRKVFEIMGLSPEVTEERFGHLINAYEYGAPPHAGMAPGFDRLVMLLANEENIREVIAFPVNSSGQTSVMDAPSTATDKQLKELHIKVDLPKEKKK
ncbi:MAG: aspartate--tRNA ligase [Candidatus Doudnabacteria bacterium]